MRLNAYDCMSSGATRRLKELQPHPSLPLAKSPRKFNPKYERFKHCHKNLQNIVRSFFNLIQILQWRHFIG